MVLPKEERLPVIWVIAGMTTQWPQMGKALMEVPVFKETIDRCHAVLQKVDETVNLIEIVTFDDPTIFDNIINPFFAICAIELGFVNILKALDLEPDYLVGHSLGEVAAAYVDGCLTEEQAILASYYRGLVTKNGNVTGLMAIAWMGAEELEKILPEGVEIGCHNAPNCCSITGTREAVENFLATFDEPLRSKMFHTSTIPFHSSLIKHLGPKLAEYLKEVIPNPKERSKKWYSSSVKPENWNTDEARICGPEYFVNNFTGVVYFAEVFKMLPEKSIIFDLSPSGIFANVSKHQEIEAIAVSLAEKDNLDGVNFLISQLKRIEQLGFDIDISKLRIDQTKYAY